MTEQMWLVCPECEGEGTVSMLKGVAYTRDEIEEQFEDGAAGYLDTYNNARTPCSTCRGRTTVKAMRCDECQQDIVAGLLPDGDLMPIQHHPCDSASISEQRYFAMIENRGH